MCEAFNCFVAVGVYNCMVMISHICTMSCLLTFFIRACAFMLTLPGLIYFGFQVPGSFELQAVNWPAVSLPYVRLSGCIAISKATDFCRSELGVRLSLVYVAIGVYRPIWI